MWHQNIYNLLQYNPLWRKKLDSLGKHEDYDEEKWMDSEILLEIGSLFKDFELLTFNP